MAPSEQPAVPRSVRPRPKPPAPQRFFRRPDLLERGPMVGSSLLAQEPPRVGVLEAEVHLEAAVVRAAGVRPAALVAMDTKECPEMRRVFRPPVDHVGAVLPEVDRL